MKTDAEFLSALQDSQTAVDTVAAFLAAKGASVTVQPVKVRPTFEQRFDYQDNGDIHITQRIEVKQKQTDFTCLDDFPFPTIITDAVYKVDAIPWGNLHSYVIVNRALTHAALVPAVTRKHWEPIRVWDSKEREHRSYYVCPKHLATFFQLES